MPAEHHETLKRSQPKPRRYDRSVLWLLLCCSRPPKAPGVLLVTLDTWRADHFSPELTPEAWDLGERGARFRDAWSPIGLTTPAHATILTGHMPPEHGLRANNHHGYALGGDEVTLAERFQEAGYATAAFVSAYPAGPEGGMAQGFEHFSGPEASERPTAETLSEARAWLDQQGGPWFLWLHAYDPHGPYEPIGWDGEDSDPARYAGEVRQADRLLGPFVREAMARGSTVLWTSDHGEVLAEEKCGVQHERSSSEVVLRVPLVVAGPGVPGGAVDRRVGLSEVMPTLLHLAGLEDPREDLFTIDREVWVGESGLCDPNCTAGCAPEGVLGKDRVVYGETSLIDRPGVGLLGDESLAPHLAGWAVPSGPTGTVDEERAKALGYME